MSSKTLVVMSIILLALMALFMYGKPVDKQPGDKERLFSFSGDDVQSITIDHVLPTATPAASPGQSSASPSASASPAAATHIHIVLEKQGDQWIVQSPTKMLGMTSDIVSFAGALAQLQQEDKLPNSGASSYGLSTPDVIEVKTKTDTHTIKLGLMTVTNSGYYAQVDSRPDIVVTGPNLSTYLQKPAEQWREKSPLGGDAYSASKFSVVHDSQTLTLEKDKDNQWQITQPFAAVASTDAAGLPNQFKSVIVHSFPTDVKADDPRLKPVYTFSLWDKGQTTPSTLTVGALDPKTKCYYAVRSPLNEVMLIDAKILPLLQKSPQDLEDKHVLAFEQTDLHGFTISVGSTTVDAKRDDVDWNIDKPVTKKDDLHKIDAIIDHLHGITWSKKLTGNDAKADLGFTSPAVRIVLTKDKGEKLATLELGKEAPDHCAYIRVAEHPDVAYIIPDTSLTYLKNSPAAILPDAASPSPAASSSGSPAASSSSSALAPSGAPSASSSSRAATPASSSAAASPSK